MHVAPHEGPESEQCEIEEETPEIEELVRKPKSNDNDINPWGVEDEILSSDINLLEDNKLNEDIDKELLDPNYGKDEEEIKRMHSTMNEE